MVNTYIVEGGLGKCVSFSAVIDSLVKKDNDKIQIYTPYHEIFANNPKVKLVFDANTINIQDERILSSSNIINCEPYKTNFLKGEEHIIERYCKILGIKYDVEMRPKLFTEYVKQQADKLLEDNQIYGKYMIVQFSGGQSLINKITNSVYNNSDPGRNYPFWLAQSLINKLKQDNPDRTILHFGFSNEPRYDNVTMLETAVPIWHEIAKKSEGFIGIDSCLNHLSSSAEMNGVVIWGSTRFNQFGYSNNVNINYYFQDNWEENKFNALDPRNIMVDPDTIMELYKEKING